MCRNQVFLIFGNNKDLNKIKKNPAHAFVGICKWETYANFQQKIFNCRVAGARQNFQTFRQNI